MRLLDADFDSFADASEVFYVTAGDSRNPRRNLWLGVLAQAFDDALLTHGNSHRGTHQQEADYWLRSNSASFRYVCLLAGIHHDFIRRTYLRRLALAQ